jgi:hypothetical protein
MRLFVILALALAIAAPVASAQPGPGPAPAADRREAIKKKIRAMRAYTLTEELQLDEKTAGKLFPVLAKWDDVTDKLLVQRVDLTRQLRQADQLRDAKAIERLIDDAVANQKAFWDLEDKRLVELRRILTPVQTARLLIVLPEFERKIQNQLRRAIQKKPRAAQRPQPDDDDDDIEPGEEPARGGAMRPGPAKQGLPPPKAKCDPFDSRYGCGR